MSEIRTFPTADDWTAACAERLAEALAAGARENRGASSLACSGGSTPEPIYRHLSGLRATQDWQHTTVTLIDERYVPEDHPESNAALVKRTLMTGAATGAGFVPLFSPEVTVDRAAAVATRRLAIELDGRPLDAVLLGMGEDGHICSMFPESPTLKTLLTPTLKPAILGVPQGRDGLAPTRERLSMNLPWLMTARRVVLAITGRQKRAVFERDAQGDPKVTPIAALIAANVALEVLWTEGAA
ncbi:MAG TPA: 6-phosphogluconolactonase [Brevundimonas sp.]|jgi:6-phosphogluconolactonase|uniref:6-phosphogluconolactonase n=1 Tax=Brevundimonas sp. TaxID=1871086 RepID=UPI002DEEDC27|nr:6-phosphogluconolactonase [Brevundimonas sp.]